MKISPKLFISLVFLLPVFRRCESYFPAKRCDKHLSMPGDHQQKENINQVLSSIRQKIQFSPENYAFHIAGSDSNTIYGHAQCRGDINQQNCLACVLDATRRIKADCPSSAQAEIWYELCFLRYDSTNFLKQVVDDPVHGWLEENVFIPWDNISEFKNTVKTVITVSIMKAMTASNRFGAMKSPSPNNQETVFGMVQCTANLQPLHCNYCINSLMNAIMIKVLPSCGGGTSPSCNIFTASCMLKYQISNFLASPIA